MEARRWLRKHRAVAAGRASSHVHLRAGATTSMHMAWAGLGWRPGGGRATGLAGHIGRLGMRDTARAAMAARVQAYSLIALLAQALLARI